MNIFVYNFCFFFVSYSVYEMVRSFVDYWEYEKQKKKWEEMEKRNE